MGTPEFNKKIQKLTEIAKVIEEATGYEAFGFIPGIVFVGVDGKQVSIENETFLERLAHTLKTGEKPETFQEEYDRIEKEKEERLKNYELPVWEEIEDEI